MKMNREKRGMGMGRGRGIINKLFVIIIFIKKIKIMFSYYIKKYY